ncbi:MAG: hypothetical protein GEV28_17360 [Actinophytocola sp.]|uniref:Rv3654c family TadE-like protein n=1 Tax=Actinophytocola sp. TaxID=1872138 RepID=UPI0013224191|nr:hypothetical protein [Actinophytocola sp.]
MTRPGVARAARIARLPGGSDDRGAATVWAAGAIAALLVVSMLVVSIGAAAATRHRAEGAADLAALAAAGAAVEGERAACGKARWVTDRMRVQLQGCRLDGWDALIEVVAVPSGVLDGFGPAKARARAGPVEQPANPGERSSAHGKRRFPVPGASDDRHIELQSCLSRYSLTVSQRPVVDCKLRPAVVVPLHKP